MSGDVRLDAATLRWCAAWHEEQRVKALTFAKAAIDPSLSRTTATAHRFTAEHFEALATEAASRPPALSDWIRACEGTGLGEFEWGHGHRSICLRWREHATAVEIIHGGGVWVGRWPDDRDTAVQRCATPADLRAALERIAAEAGR